MPRLIVLIALGIIAFIVYRRVQALPAGQRKSAYLKIGLAVLVVVVILGTVTGRMHWLGAALTALLVAISRGLPILVRLFPMLQWLHGRRSQAQGSESGQQSTVETMWLRMVLDHDSGDMHGEVLSGNYAGQKLDDLDRKQLGDLLGECEQEADSARLLNTYLARRFGEQQSRENSAETSGTMTRQQALAILGLAEGASDQDITDTHRRLMQKLHPDRGGSDYLAAKLNQAKELLLG